MDVEVHQTFHHKRIVDSVCKSRHLMQQPSQLNTGQVVATKLFITNLSFQVETYIFKNFL